MRPFSFVLLVLKKVHVGRIVPTEHERVEFHLLDLHGQLLGRGSPVVVVLAALVMLGSISTQSILSSHEEGDGALVVLGGRPVRASLVGQSAEGDVMAGGGDEVLGQSVEEGSVLVLG